MYVIWGSANSPPRPLHRHWQLLRVPFVRPTNVLVFLLTCIECIEVFGLSNFKSAVGLWPRDIIARLTPKLRSCSVGVLSAVNTHKYTAECAHACACWVTAESPAPVFCSLNVCNHVLRLYHGLDKCARAGTVCGASATVHGRQHTTYRRSAFKSCLSHSRSLSFAI